MFRRITCGARSTGSLIRDVYIKEKMPNYMKSLVAQKKLAAQIPTTPLPHSPSARPTGHSPRPAKWVQAGLRPRLTRSLMDPGVCGRLQSTALFHDCSAMPFPAHRLPDMLVQHTRPSNPGIPTSFPTRGRSFDNSRQHEGASRRESSLLDQRLCRRQMEVPRGRKEVSRSS